MFTFKIDPDGRESFTVRGTSRDIAQWERTTKGASLGKIQEDMSVTALYAIAFHACRRQGLWTGTQAEFEQSCDIDTIDDDEDEAADPTLTAV